MDTIKKTCDFSNGFTFGNSQKLVNMTAKYMFLSSNVCEKNRCLFENCDCPMDGKLLRVVKRKAKESRYKKLFSDKKLRSNISWSSLQLNDDKVPSEYEIFQEYVDIIAQEEGLLAIEVDFKYWDMKL